MILEFWKRKRKIKEKKLRQLGIELGSLDL
jgi:hypothetical protein